MKKPPENTSSEGLRAYGVYPMARLRAEPRAKDLVVEFAKVQDTLKARADERAEADEASVVALAAKDQAFENLCDVVVRLSLKVLEANGNDRSSAAYRAVLPGGTSAITRAPVNEALGLVRVLEQKVGEGAGGPEAKGFLKTIKGAREALEAAAGGHTSALEKEAAARSRERAARDDWRRQYEASYGLLLARFPKGAAERFFRRVETRRRADGAAKADAKTADPKPGEGASPPSSIAA